MVLEERRMRTDSNPEGRLLEQLLATAYVAHNYGRSGVGWPSEVGQITATEAMDFPQEVLRGIEHRDCRGGRRQGCRGDAHSGEILQQDSRAARSRWT